jgi:mannitol-1-phosphate 5-dehydrogenase
MKNHDKSILIIGAGNIGRGVIGGLFFKAGYKLVIYDIMAERMRKLSEQGKYVVERVGAEKTERINVDNFEVLDCSDTKQLVDRISIMGLVACCVYEGAFKSICNNISEAIKLRVKNKKGYLNVLLCVNALGAHAYFTKHITDNLADDEEALAYFNEKVGICQVLVGMAGMPSTPDLLEQDPFAVTTRLGGHVDIDRENFKGEPPVVESVGITDKADAKIYRKVYTGNMKHTMTAFMGHANGYKYISDCSKDLFIKECAIGAFYEAEEAIQKEFNFNNEERQAWIDNIININNSKLKDPIARVAAKPVSKLARSNRFVGPALMCIKYHILPYYLSKGIAYAFLYKDDNDPESVEIAQYVEKNDIDSAIDKYCELTDKDWVLKELIKKQYNEAKKLR